MSGSISRESFQEAKNYLGVHFQQGRPVLDADLNEAQAVLRSMVRGVARDSAGDGSPNEGFAIEPLHPPRRRPNTVDFQRSNWEDFTWSPIDYGLAYLLDRAGFFLTVPGDLLEDFESGGFTASQGRVRVSRDRPYRGEGFLRVSGHTGPVTVSRQLDGPRDLSEFDVATFRYRLNRPAGGLVRFFLEDVDGNRTVWPCRTPRTFPANTWLAAVAAPLDPRFRIHTSTLPDAQVGSSYRVFLTTYNNSSNATPPISWSLAGEDLQGLAITGSYDGAGGLTSWAQLEFQPTTAGTVSFDVTVTDGAERSITRTMSITVREAPDGGSPLPLIDLPHGEEQFWRARIDPETPTGTPADLTAVRRYGFELFQADEPLVWDVDDLRLGGASLQERRGANDFVIRGGELAKHVRRSTLVSRTLDENGEFAPGLFGVGGTAVFAPFTPFYTPELHDRVGSELLLADQAADGTGRFHLAGLPCAQAEDTLYSDQADPNDPPLTPPPAGQVRRDVVYLDAWTEPVTYVQDPAIREVALGGPDTSTRERVRHRVRVAEGGHLPTGDGMGSGTLATEGTYTAAANRLYRVEIDGPGDIGAATFRWSNENASVIARVIEPVPPGSTVVVVEDASAFHPGDLILLRKEFGAERHEVSQVTGNEITLAAATGDQLGQLPGAATPEFTTFALADRPMVQRWDGFGVAITEDPDDETISASIPLDDGVRVRFGGHGMRSGDFWTFTARYLPGDQLAGTGADSRIERLGFARPQGVRHHYATLAAFTRHGDGSDRDRITDIEDLRSRLGHVTRSVQLRQVLFAGSAQVHLGGVRLRGASRGAEYLVILTGRVRAGAGLFVGSNLNIVASFYSDEMTDPQTSPTTGRLLRIPSGGFFVPDEDNYTHLTLLYRYGGIDGQSQLPVPSTPATSVQFFVQPFLASGAFGEAVLRAMVLEQH